MRLVEEGDNRDKQRITLNDNIREVAKELQAIYSQAEIHYTSAVNDVIRRQKQKRKRN